jgi:hypothetical protein
MLLGLLRAEGGPTSQWDPLDAGKSELAWWTTSSLAFGNSATELLIIGPPVIVSVHWVKGCCTARTPLGKRHNPAKRAKNRSRGLDTMGSWLGRRWTVVDPRLLLLVWFLWTNGTASCCYPERWHRSGIWALRRLVGGEPYVGRHYVTTGSLERSRFVSRCLY